MRAPLCFVILSTICCSAPHARQSGETSPSSQVLKPGVVLPKVICSSHPDQSYALYLPSGYTQDKRWPIVYAFDPGARGSVPVETMKDAAEKYGFLVVGSNNSRNGDWKPQTEAAPAIFQDTHARLAIDDTRVYFAGFSGAARLAASLAQRCKCAAGVMLNGAGFAPSSPPAQGAGFVVFAAVGTLDFNYGDVVQLDTKLRGLGYSRTLRRFDGPHQWAPAAVMEEALAWFRLMAMKTGREQRDSSFLSTQYREAEKRARTLEVTGDPYGCWKEYLQAEETFDGLAETSTFRERAAALENEKAVRDGARREQQESAEQPRLTADISAGFSALLQDNSNREDVRSQVDRQILALRNSAEHEKRPEKLRVLKRAQAGVFVEAMASGAERINAKDYSRAVIFFELGADADPESNWGLANIAVARALEGNRKGASEALRRARAKTKDAAGFSAWMQDEPAFAKLRDSAEFRSLLTGAQVP